MIDCKNSKKSPMQVLTFKDYWMFYDDDIEFNGNKYKNTSCLIYLLINDGTLKTMAFGEKSTSLDILSKKDVNQIGMIAHSWDQICQ